MPSMLRSFSAALVPVALFALASILSLGVSAPSLSAQSFVDATVAAGLVADHNALDTITGQAWGDFNRDGCPDLYLTDNLGPNRLYQNDCDGTFSLASFAAVAELTTKVSAGAAWADYDNDGWLDLYVGAKGGGTLFRNMNGTMFEDVTVAAGVADTTGLATSVAWGDVDADGWLDLYVVNYYDPGAEEGEDRLFRNNADGSFTDVSQWLGDGTARSRPGFVARFLDIDFDGDQDIYVVNDKQVGNPLWRNDGGGCGGWCFTEVSEATGADRPVCGMGVAVGDYDGDLDWDLYFSSIDEQVLLASQRDLGTDDFIEVTDAAGVNSVSIGWGSAFFDYDNDTWPDLFLSTMNADPADRLFHNLGNGTFEDVSAGSGASDSRGTLGVTAADYDGDGRVDLIVGNINDEYTLLRNIDADAADNSWVGLRFSGRGTINRDALGTIVEVHTSGGRVLLDDVHSGSSLGGNHDLTLHFGLAADIVTDVVVTWPSGVVQNLGALAAETIHEVVYPDLFSGGFEGGSTAGWTVFGGV
ncbi:MAG: CRTAC1 family protein [Acidobacteriota bacterium]